MRNIRKLLRNNKGEAYIGVAIFILIAVFMTVFAMQMGAVTVKKLSLDSEIKQIVKTVQIEGGVTENTKDVIENVRNKYNTDGTERIKIAVKGEEMTLVSGTTDEYMIQLGKAFEVDADCTYRIGFGKLGIDIPLTSKQIGVSERYWKELDS